MPEAPECRIMSEYIKEKSKGQIYTNIYNSEKGNHFKDTGVDLTNRGTLSVKSRGKQIIIKFGDIKISIFMGMNGNWKFIPTKDVCDTKYIRLRLDTKSGNSLILYGGYMGPKWKFGDFTSKRGPDPSMEFEEFKSNILSNIDKRDFDAPIFEALLNQKYFNGIGNYLRSTILYYSNINPFEPARKTIEESGERLFEFCRDIPLKSYKLNGGQLKDWSNPYGKDSDKFNDWVFYRKGYSIKDTNGRTFWYNPKWGK